MWVKSVGTTAAWDLLILRAVDPPSNSLPAWEGELAVLRLDIIDSVNTNPAGENVPSAPLGTLCYPCLLAGFVDGLQ